MDKVFIHDKVFVPFIPYEKVSQIIDGVALKLNEDFCSSECSYASRSEKDIPGLLCVLHCSIMFTGELLKRLDFPLEVCAIKLASYQGTGSTGKIQETLEFRPR